MEQNSSLNWIKDLVKAEEQMEETGVVDLSAGADTDKILVQSSIQFLNELKNRFIEASISFNSLKASALGRLKIYGIAKTHADFMLFRNGFKMIFALSAPGEISIRFNFMGTANPIPSPIPNAPGINGMAAAPILEENVLKLKMGAFGDLKWTYKEQDISVDNVVRYHMTLFIKESAK